MSLDAYNPLPSRFPVNSSDHSGKTRKRFPDAGMLASSLRVVADSLMYHQMCPAVTMWEDVLAVELEEHVDNPSTTIGI